LESTSGQTITLITKETGITIGYMGSARTRGAMEGSIQAFGISIRWTASENMFGLKISNTKDSSLKTKRKDMVSTRGMTVEGSRGGGTKASSMV